MKQTNDGLIFSASDLVGFLACRHLTQLESLAAVGAIERPHRRDPLLDLLSKRGDEHEKAYLKSLQDSGLTVIEIERTGPDPTSIEAATQATLDAMRSGADIVYQATLFDGRWQGHVDFLRRVERPSGLGAHSYEVEDAKLARRAKAPAVLQLCAYSDQLAGLQGTTPEWMHLVLGTGTIESFRLRDFAAYYRMVKCLFEVDAGSGRGDTYPDPVEHCTVCRWAIECRKRRRADDHLSLVADIRSDHIRKLLEAGVTNVVDLAARDPSQRVKGVGAKTLTRLQDQASMQVERRATGKPFHKILDPPGPGKGLEALPQRSEGDLFFDIEADPYAEGDGLEFLFGFVDRDEEEPRYTSLWAHDRSQERSAFQHFIDLVMERFARYPGLHVYHFGIYEPAALKRLMGRHSTREEELDRLLRAGVFVDLHRVVRQGLRASEESYSIKKLETLYGFKRTDDISEGSSAIVEYERYLDSEDQSLLDAIAQYNRADCESLIELVDWLEARRTEAEGLVGQPLSRPPLGTGDPSEDLARALDETAGLVEALCQDVPDDANNRTEEQQARWLLAQLLQWHRREAKSEWWVYFDRTTKTVGDLIEDSEALAGLEYQGIEEELPQSFIHRYSFPTQEHKIRAGKNYVDPTTQAGIGTVTEIDDERHVVLVKRAKRRTEHPRAIAPGQPVATTVLRRALARTAEWIKAHGIEGDGRHRAVRSLLLRHPPRLQGIQVGTALKSAGEDLPGAAVRLALALEESYLPVQGPPGTGKTTRGADMVVALVRAGRKVGITATSHKVITNLLQKVCEAAHEQGVHLRALQRCDADEACDADDVTIASNNQQFDTEVATGAYGVIAGTAWLFSRPELDESLDALFIDEAGQMSLATAVAMSGVARNLILLGDPQQLAQPSKGIHPEGAASSVLEHALAGAATIPPDMGLFLERTWRMHPALCDFVSEAFYEGRLESAPQCEQQKIHGDDFLAGSGTRYVPVEHDGNRIMSSEEASAISKLVEDLVGRSWTNERGEVQDLTLNDILVVAPYNAQVGLLRQSLPVGARVGTVDKFQGQEGAATIYSMTTSNPVDIPRNFQFLYSTNRLNVAVSRARALAILVASPRLLLARCATPEQMRLANALCRYVEMAVDPST